MGTKLCSAEAETTTNLVIVAMVLLTYTALLFPGLQMPRQLYNQVRQHPCRAMDLQMILGALLSAQDQYPPPDSSYSHDLLSLIRSMLCKVGALRHAPLELLGMGASSNGQTTFSLSRDASGISLQDIPAH